MTREQARMVDGSPRYSNRERRERKQKGLSKIFDAQSGRTIITALDDSSITGPEHHLRDMQRAMKVAVANGSNAILGFYGMFKQYPEELGDRAGILNLTLSTEGPHHLRKVLVGSPEQADMFGLAGVSVHVNTTAPHEPEMLEILGQTAQNCDALGIPLLAHVYPRTITDGKEDHYSKLKANDPNAYAKFVRHGARIAADLGADIIKVPYTGTAESFQTVVESAYGLPVVMAGGPLTDVPTFLENAHTAIEVGAKGIAIGRNYFERPFTDEDELVLLALGSIVHKGMDVHNAMLRSELVLFGRRMPEILAQGFQPGSLDGHERSYYPQPDGVFTRITDGK